MSEVLPLFIDTFIPRPVSHSVIDRGMLIVASDTKRLGVINELPPALMEKLDAFLGKDDLIILPRNVADKRNHLAQRNDVDYGNDKSAADMAFASMLLNDGFTPDETDLAMRHTRYRDKFDSRRGETSYLWQTIRKVMSGVSKPMDRQSDFEGPELTPKLIDGELRIAGRLQLSDAICKILEPHEVIPRAAVIEDLIPEGKFAILAAPGASAKTVLAIAHAVHIVLGLKWAGRKVAAGCVIIFAGEEDQDEVNRRVSACVKSLNLSAAEIALVNERLRIFPMAGLDMAFTRMEGRAVQRTSLVKEVIHLAKELEIFSGVQLRLIVIDHARLAGGGDPNAAQDVTVLTNALSHVAEKTKAAVLMLAHSPKSVISKKEGPDASEVAGSSAYVDNARLAMIMRGMTPEEAKFYGYTEEARKTMVRLIVVKSNYYAPSEIWLQRVPQPAYQTITLTPVDMTPAATAFTPMQKKSPEAVVERLVTLLTEKGPLSPSYIRKNYVGEANRLKTTRPLFELAMETGIDIGVFVKRPTSSQERAKLGGQVREVLALVDSQGGKA